VGGHPRTGQPNSLRASPQGKTDTPRASPPTFSLPHEGGREAPHRQTRAISPASRSQTSRRLPSPSWGGAGGGGLTHAQPLKPQSFPKTRQRHPRAAPNQPTPPSRGKKSGAEGHPRPTPNQQTPPLPLVGRGWGWGATHAKPLKPQSFPKNRPASPARSPKPAGTSHSCEEAEGGGPPTPNLAKLSPCFTAGENRHAARKPPTLSLPHEGGREAAGLPGLAPTPRKGFLQDLREYLGR
jgi:hypothetical protein